MIVTEFVQFTFQTKNILFYFFSFKKNGGWFLNHNYWFAQWTCTNWFWWEFISLKNKKTITELRYEGRIEILCFRIESSNKKKRLLRTRLIQLNLSFLSIPKKKDLNQQVLSKVVSTMKFKSIIFSLLGK